MCEAENLHGTQEQVVYTCFIVDCLMMLVLYDESMDDRHEERFDEILLHIFLLAESISITVFVTSSE